MCTGELYRLPVDMRYWPGEQSKVFYSDRARFDACCRDAYSIPQAQAAFTRAWGAQRSDAVTDLCRSSIGEGRFGHSFKPGANRRDASAVHERCSDSAAGVRPCERCTRPERRTANSDVSDAQMPEVASGGQGRETGLAHHDHLPEAFCSRAGEASGGTRTAYAAG
jgi:hypothetical protein